MILLVTHDSDPHGDQLVYELHELGFDGYARIDLGQLCERTRIDLAFDRRQWDWSIEFPGFPERRIDASNLRTVWMHRPVHPSRVASMRDPSQGEIDASQAYHAATWLLNRLQPEVFPLGTPAAQQAAENKFRQLETAAAVGFEVLPTLYSSSPESVTDFIRRHDRVVVKAIGRQAYHTHNREGQAVSAIFGARVFSAEDLIPLVQDSGEVQLFVQAAVQKVAEHRVTVLPDRIIDCRIDTSSLPGDDVDYRQHLTELSYQVVDPPEGIETRIRAYLKRFSLGSGCFDFAETEDGRLVFFECNPVGEWWWIQRLSGDPISRALAKSLVRHHERASAPLSS